MMQARREGTAIAMCVMPAYDTNEWLGRGVSASVIHRVSALARRSLSALQVNSLPQSPHCCLVLDNQACICLRTYALTHCKGMFLAGAGAEHFCA